MDRPPPSEQDLLDPVVPRDVGLVEVPLVDGRDPTLQHMVQVVEGDPRAAPIPIVPWPVPGDRRLDPGTGIGAGTTEGSFTTRWVDGRLHARNAAVGGAYVIGLASLPGVAEPPGAVPLAPPEQVLLWHLNHHPDGGQLFASADGRPFAVVLCPVGDPPDLGAAVAATSDGSFALTVLPGVWHDGVYPLRGDGTFWTRQGRVHARVSVDLGHELGQLLRVRLRP